MNADVAVLSAVGAIVGALLSVISAFVSRRSSQQRDELLHQEISLLAEEYAQLRETMPSGHERTLQMETIADRIRALGTPQDATLQELMLSEEPGERLGAAVALQVSPNAKYAHWLAERLRNEQPFVGYHSALALLSAAKRVDQSNRLRVKTAIEEARLALGAGKEDSDRWAVLNEAARHLDALQH